MERDDNGSGDVLDGGNLKTCDGVNRINRATDRLGREGCQGQYTASLRTSGIRRTQIDNVNVNVCRSRRVLHTRNQAERRDKHMTSKTGVRGKAVRERLVVVLLEHNTKVVFLVIVRCRMGR